MIEIGGIGAILTDIEGTTSSIAFVHDVLFPYARQHLPGYVRAHGAELAPILDTVRTEVAEGGLDIEGVIAVLLRWIDEDRKATPLKELQGRIWRKGYEAGELKGHIYADAIAGLQRWRGQGLKLYVYSSGSIEAQRLIFGHTAYGDLTPWFSGFFDTTIGGKLQAGSYTSIAVQLGLLPDRVLFLSDNPGEIDAAQRAGMKTVHLMRDETPEQGSVTSFDEIRVLAGADAA